MSWSLSPESGDSLNLEPKTAGAIAPTQASGCLLEKSGHFVLVERTTNVVPEPQDSDLSKQVGNRVEVTGRTETGQCKMPGASELISVAGLKQVSKGGCSAIAKKIGASAAVAAGAAGAGAAAGAAGAATAAGIGAVAVIGGVAVAATVGGLAAVGDLPGRGSNYESSARH